MPGRGLRTPSQHASGVGELPDWVCHRCQREADRYSG